MGQGCAIDHAIAAMMNAIIRTSSVANRISNDEEDALLTLLVALYDEARRVCILIGLNGAVANALEEGRKPVQWRMLLRFYPRQSAGFLIATQRISRYWSDTDVACALSDFHSALSKAADALISFAASSPNFDPKAICGLGSAYRDSCAKGEFLLQTIEQQLSSRSLLKEMLPDQRLRTLLLEVVQRESPGVTAKGIIEMPSWAERRNHRRITVNCPAKILGQDDARVVIENISLAGLALRFSTTSTGVKVGDQLTLSLASSEQISGTVMWTDQGKAAIRFQQQPDQIDPRLKFCLSKNQVDDLLDTTGLPSSGKHRGFSASLS